MNEKNGAHLRWNPEKNAADRQADFLPDDTARDQLAQLLTEFQQDLKAKGYPALCEQVDEWLWQIDEQPENALYEQIAKRLAGWIELFRLVALREELRYFADRDPVAYAKARKQILVHLGWGWGTFEQSSKFWQKLDEEHPGAFENYLDVYIDCEKTGRRIWCSATPPNLAEDYLKDRGITDDTVKAHSLEIDLSPSQDQARQRLSRSLPHGVLEIIWCPLFDAQGVIYSYIARILPTIGETKFLCPHGSDGLPYIPKTVFDLPLGQPVIITEGPIKALACVQAGCAAIGLNGVWGAAVADANGEFRFRADLLSALDWRGRNVYLAFDADLLINSRVRQALFRTMFVLKTAGAEVYHPSWDLAQGKGIDDYLMGRLQANGQHDPATVLAGLIKDAKPLIEIINPNPLDLGLIASELQKVHLPDLLREQLCKELAKRLNVTRESLRGIKPQPPAGQGPTYAETLKPWPDPVDGESLLNEIKALLNLIIIMDEDSLNAVTLWTLLTCLSDTDAIDTLALLVVLSPTKRCGKTRLLTALSRLTRRALYCVRPSAAVIYRVIGKYGPTILVDEADELFKDNKGYENTELREVFCAGFNPGVFVPRCVGDSHDIENFPTWCPKVIGLSGSKLPDTIFDRAVPIKLQRKDKTQKTIPLRDVFPGLWLDFRRKLLRLAKDIADQVRAAKPAIPTGMNDRAEDAWLPLLAIAENVGGDWPKLAKAAALKLSAGAEDHESVAIQLLTALKKIFEDAGQNVKDGFLFTSAILSELNSNPQAPWADWRNGSGISAKGLASLLKPFGIKSEKATTVPQHWGYGYNGLKPHFDRYV
jgi:hypothetical protein